MKNFSITSCFVLLCCFISLSSIYADNTPLEEELECAPLSFEMFLPEGLSAEDVVSFELIEMGAASNIYEIHTVDGGKFYEVLSTVTLRVLPLAAKTACVGITKNYGLCNYVYKAGAAIINIFEDDLSPKVEEFWAAKISGAKGYASLFTKTRRAARKGQVAFEESRTETGYPWQAANLVTYSNWSERLGSGKSR